MHCKSRSFSILVIDLCKHIFLILNSDLLLGGFDKKTLHLLSFFLFLCLDLCLLSLEGLLLLRQPHQLVPKLLLLELLLLKHVLRVLFLLF